ncbi:MAG TPA: isoprenylcysteine carboxylmethyltransferase family protein [Ktedonobacterales bacterium]
MQPTTMVKPTQRPDSPGVRIPPPIYYIAAFLLGLFLQSRFPLPTLPPPVALGVGIPLTALGVLFAGASVPTMLRGHGTLNTDRPSAALVTSGLYRLTRNPMYLALTLVGGGLACALGITWALPLLIPVVIYTQIGVIMPEERYLERTFGDAYRAYRRRVRRWL